MTFLVVGLGSMGKRRIRNLQHLQAGSVIGYDPRADRRADAERLYGVTTFAGLEEAMAQQPDALIISTPPELHYTYARAAAAAGKHFFSEVGVGTDTVDALMQLTDGKALVAAPSCTFRFHPLVQLLKRVVEAGDAGRIVSFSSHSGQYLPDWHPWEDYRSFWASKRETGACREQFVLEATWLTWVLGPIRSVACLKDKLTSLDTPIDDVYQMIVRLDSGALGHLMLDVVSRVPLRWGRLFSEQAVVEWSFTEQRVRVYREATKRWQDYPVAPGHTETGYIHAEEMYIREMEQFVRAVRGEEPWSYSFADERRIQQTLEAAEHAAERGTCVTVDTWRTQCLSEKTSLLKPVS